MPYTHIARNYVRAGGVGTDATIPHTVGVATEYCVFLAQDTTSGGAANAIPLAFAGDAGKGAAQILVTDGTNPNALRIDAVIVAPHSVIDVGPVVTGATRANALATAADGIWAFGTSGLAYRSLHRTVPITVVNGAPTGTVNITHRLGTNAVVAFASPSSSPLANSSVGGNIRAYKVHQTAAAGGTVTLTMAIDDAGNNVGADATVTWDVMILARAAVNANTPLANWPFAMTRHTAPATGASSDDYSGADAARALAGSYAALYTNVDLGLGANIITHNFGTAADCVALVAHSATAPGTSVPTISNNATSTTTLTLTTVTAGCNDCYVLMLRPYSMFQPTCTTA
jgi:hypothetical protein